MQPSVLDRESLFHWATGSLLRPALRQKEIAFSPSFKKNLYTSGHAKIITWFQFSNFRQSEFYLENSFFLLSFSLLKYVLGKRCDEHRKSLWWTISPHSVTPYTAISWTKPVNWLFQTNTAEISQRNLTWNHFLTWSQRAMSLCRGWGGSSMCTKWIQLSSAMVFSVILSADKRAGGESPPHDTTRKVPWWMKQMQSCISIHLRLTPIYYHLTELFLPFCYDCHQSPYGFYAYLYFPLLVPQYLSCSLC